MKADLAYSSPLPVVFLVLVMFHPGSKSQPSSSAEADIVAAPADSNLQLDARHPFPAWQHAIPVKFSADWQGKNADPTRETQVRALWSPETLFLRLECRYREIHVFTDSDPNGRRNHLWDRDVAEAFIQPDPTRERYYKEFEVSPNGMWIDLDITPGSLTDLKSGMQRSVWLDESSHAWMAELAIPMKSLTQHFTPDQVWRVNFFRVEGKQEPRFYSAWQPTYTPEPNFHVPRAFGQMRFAPAKSPAR